MRTSTNKKAKPGRSFVPTIALAKSIKFDKDMMHVNLMDGRIISVPLIWFPRLWKATAKQLKAYEIAGGGISMHWPQLDEDLSLAGLMAGVDTRSA